MKIAILGATSQIAKDLIEAFAKKTDYECTLFARNPSIVIEWLKKVNIQQLYQALDYSYFNTDHHYDVILNFVGVGNPAQAQEMGSKIFDVTYKYDMMALDYLKVHSETKYIFLSSGAVYGGNFEQPVTSESVAVIPINNLNVTDWYAIAKLYAEARHRALPELSIVDIRVFNYFSHTQDMNARYFITDIVRAIRDNTILISSVDYIVRDFLHPSDFYQLIYVLIFWGGANTAIDCYSLMPIDKPRLLAAMKEMFELRYEVTETFDSVGATGHKPYYYSLNTHAAYFGYKPTLTSLEGLTREIKFILEK